MYLKRYSLGSFVLIALIGSYIFTSVTQEKIALDMFGIVLPAQHIAVWVMLALFVLYVVSILHMSFYSFLGSIKLSKYDRDYNKFIDALADAYLKKDEENYQYSTSKYTLLGSIIDKSTLSPTKALKATTQNDRLDAVINLIDDINKDIVVDLKKYSLKPQNPWMVKNDRNRYKNGDLSAEYVLGHSSDFDATIVQEAYIDYIKSASFSNIEKHKLLLNKKALLIILSRINAKSNSLEISNDVLISLFNTLELDAKDFIKVSTALSINMVPDQRMKLFETLYESRADAMEAYLFTLLDLQMLTPAKDLLANTQSDEYQNLKAYSELKECGKNFNINLFL